MKKIITVLMMITLIVVSGCMNTSKQGGIAPTNEEFSITVPSSMTIVQGFTEPITITLNRGSDFKQDVQFDIKANDISVSPTNILVKSSDKPEVQIQITAVRNAALGNYIFSVKGTPTNGKATTAVCTVTVVTPQISC